MTFMYVTHTHTHTHTHIQNVSTADDHGILINPEPARDLATVHHLCSTYRMGLEKLVEKQPQVVPL